MRVKRTLTAAVAITLMSCGAVAQPDQNGTLVYAPSYFDELRPRTAYDMISRLPGFQFDDGSSARGFAGTAGNVLIDGQRPTSKSDGLEAILNRIPAVNVERIEVIRGGAPGVDMHGHTVIANVILKHNDSTQFVADLQDRIWPDGHHVPSAKLEYSRTSGERSLEASLSLIGNLDDGVGKGFYHVTDTATHAVRVWDARTIGSGQGWGFTSAAATPLWAGKFRANFSYSDSPFHSGNFYTAPPDDIAIVDNSGNKKGELGLTWNRRFGSFELEALVLQRLGRETYLNTYDAPAFHARFNSKNETGESIARSTLRYDYGPTLAFETGLEGAFNYLDGTSAYVENGVSVPLPSADARVEETRGEVFGQTTWSFTPEWTAEAGARFEYSRIGETGYTTKSRSFFYPKPRVVLTWTPRKDTQVRLRYERSVGQLDFDNFLASSNLAASGVNAGNPDLEPDRHSKYEVSFQYNFWEKGAINVKLFHDEISGVVDYIPVVGTSGVFDAPGNIGHGIENQLDVHFTLPLDKFGVDNGRFKFGYHLKVMRVRDPETGEKRTFSDRVPESISLTFTQDWQRLDSTWGVYFGNLWEKHYFRLTEVRHSRAISPYLEFWWEYKPSAEWTLQLAVNNWGVFSYNDVIERYAGPRAGLTPFEITELKIKSQPHLHLKIRKTFN